MADIPPELPDSGKPARWSPKPVGAAIGAIVVAAGLLIVWAVTAGLSFLLPMAGMLCANDIQPDKSDAEWMRFASSVVDVRRLPPADELLHVHSEWIREKSGLRERYYIVDIDRGQQGDLFVRKIRSDPPLSCGLRTYVSFSFVNPRLGFYRIDAQLRGDPDVGFLKVTEAQKRFQLEATVRTNNAGTAEVSLKAVGVQGVKPWKE